MAQSHNTTNQTRLELRFMVKKKRQATVTDPKYREFLDNVELYALGLENLTAHLERADYFTALADRAGDVVREIKSNLVVSEFDKDHFDINGSFVLTLKVGAEAPILTIAAVFSAHFHPRVSPFRKKEAEQFANAEAQLIFWPYFRQTVSDVTARMHIRPITIPLVLRP